jgi:hypothetical protein
LRKLKEDHLEKVEKVRKNKEELEKQSFSKQRSLVKRWEMKSKIAEEAQRNLYEVWEERREIQNLKKLDQEENLNRERRAHVRLIH